VELFETLLLIPTMFFLVLACIQLLRLFGSRYSLWSNKLLRPILRNKFC